jgi:hypothetical protein
MTGWLISRGYLRALTLLAVVVVTSSFSSSQARAQTAPASPPAPQTTAAELASLKKQNQNLQIAVDALTMRLAAVEKSNFSNALDIIVFQHATISIAPTDLGKYARLDSAYGVFLISLENVTPYLEGYRLSLDIGNMTSASFIGFSLDASWNASFDAKTDYNKWQAAEKKQTFSFPTSLLPAAWNRIELILPNTDAAHFGYLQLAITTNTVSLKR